MKTAERSKEGSDGKLGAAGSDCGGKLRGTHRCRRAARGKPAVRSVPHRCARWAAARCYMPLRARCMRSQLYSSRCCTFSIVSLSPACTLLLASSTWAQDCGDGWQGCEWSSTESCHAGCGADDRHGWADCTAVSSSLLSLPHLHSCWVRHAAAARSSRADEFEGQTNRLGNQQLTAAVDSSSSPRGQSRSASSAAECSQAGSAAD